MADTKREIERKYEATDETRLPDLTKVAGVSSVVDQGVAELDAVYYDTSDLRLAANSITLRRRTGGSDEGWHLKLPVSPDVRDEIHAPLGPDLPRALTDLVRSRVRDAPLVPAVRLLSSRELRHLVDAAGKPLAEVSIDAVSAQRLDAGAATANWTEIEVELVDGVDPAFLDIVEKRLRKAGVRPASSASKLARALEETAPPQEAPEAVGKQAPRAPKEQGRGKRAAEAPGPHTAGDHVLAYLRAQAEAIVAYDPAVRRDLPDSVHQLRVATRRLRSAFRTYRKVVDRTVTDPIAEELKWLAGELGVDRDHEVLNDRLQSRITDLPRTLLLGPVRGRLRIWSVARRTGSRRKTIAVLDSRRYLDLLNALDALLADPPLLRAAAQPAAAVVPQAITRDYDRLSTRTEHALTLPPGTEERDAAMHDARKAAKRARYAAEAAEPALGKPARRFAKRMKAVQSVLGDHQDSVVAREALRTLAIQAHAAGETAFTWGLLYGQEEAQAAIRERELPEVWALASQAKLRGDLGA
ncbi:CYTH and CHAD domain-containing protein [Streptomyces sp. H27-C3]|uniref:CYTH and CHAD domain-containing protein n=1 Tax=Streptomyces sp. H27-C3 TaxID=3046305 RepID=UPI0024B943C9|nr:CYTH and CHAD domain-containing protein [Streptomyces sp. H27-C3]MDJ0463552.1 CYTH and CHAD domain-containing protein [Streptomyces sp. H27-C3]